MTLAPWSLKDAPSLIETVFPVGRISAEAYKERKAGAGQTLTALGSYWKGRKPLILCRAVTLGCLLPATDNPAADLDVFLALLAMDDAAFGRRFQGSVGDFVRAVGEDAAGAAVDFHDEYGQPLRRPRWRDDLDEDVRAGVMAEALASLPYSIESRLNVVKRPEELDEHALLRPVWPRVNAHLGTGAASLPELVEQLGVARFGHRPKVADTFSGGGSIPFEAARIGCDVYASDLNPIACMLTWGAFNIIGASPERRAEIESTQAEVAAKVDAEITALGIEHDAEGNRAKAYLYCLETRCPKTGWMVPMAPSWVISKKRKVVATLVPNDAAKRYDILIETGVSAKAMADAERGTVQGGRLVHPVNPDRSGVEIKTIRGDKPSGGNSLRLWEKEEIEPRTDDIFQERLYAILWTKSGKLSSNYSDNASDGETFFRSVSADDVKREIMISEFILKNISKFQSDGLLSDLKIETGKENEGPIRTNGWTYWHHMFPPRSLLYLLFLKKNGKLPINDLVFARLCDNLNKSCAWNNQGEKPSPLFVSQSMKTVFNYSIRGFDFFKNLAKIRPGNQHIKGSLFLENQDSRDINLLNDLYITDPPYADAVHYHEITEFFIAWLRKNPPSPFDEWTWDSQRSKAIKGKDADFRRSMVEAYSAMTAHMPDNGLQVVMFTHQDAGVWADLAGILWAAGLRVTAAWNVVTETESALKDGNYVQGTVCLVLRKRYGTANARQMELEAEIEDEVKGELARLTGLDEGWQNYRGAEALYTDGDLTLAAYAAALRVITAYATIDRREVGSDVFRELARGEKTQLRTLIDYAESVANRELVPHGFDRGLWRNLDKASRFYVRMLDMEARGAPKVADFQNFARSFALADHTRLMGETRANKASLAGAQDLKAKLLKDVDIAAQPLFQLLFALWKSIEKDSPLIGVTQLRAHYGSDYWQLRQTLITLADYVADKTKLTRSDESVAMAELGEALKVDRL